MKKNAVISVACLSLFFLAGYADKTVAEPEKTTISDANVSTQKVSSTKNNSREGGDKRTPEMFDLCFRVVGCSVGEDARDSNLNDPPKLYVIVKKGDAAIMTSTAKKGWNVEFANGVQNEFIVDSSDKSEYCLEVWDDQWSGDEKVVSIVPVTRKLLYERIPENKAGGEKRRIVKVSGEKIKVTITFEYVGSVRWYRLANVTVPMGSPCRKPFVDAEKPELGVKIFRDGKILKNMAKSKTSTILPYGWEGNYPASPANCWPIFEDSDARYDVELWDYDEENELLFKTSNLKGESFQDPIIEKGAHKDRQGKVQFKAISDPITDD